MFRASPSAPPAAQLLQAQRGVAIFDLDGTLARRDTFLPFLLRRLRRTPSTWRRVHQLIAAAARFHTRRIDNSSLKQLFLQALFAGSSAMEAREDAAAYVDALIAGGLRENALAALATHQAAGWTTVLATASPDVYVDEIARRLGFDARLCTRMGVDERGRFTGKLDCPNCYGPNKLDRVRAWLDEQGSEGPVWVYSDHHSDLPLLKAADRAFGVCASRRLRSVAPDHGIELIHWR